MLEPTIYRTRDERANNYATDAVRPWRKLLSRCFAEFVSVLASSMCLSKDNKIGICCLSAQIEWALCNFKKKNEDCQNWFITIGNLLNSA
jgi:hypothetical protein